MKRRSQPVVLIADDDPHARTLMRLMTEEYGYRVVTARDGEEALGMAGFHQPDVVLLDVMMPLRHGYAVCHSIKEDADLRHTRVVMVTAKAFPADRRQAESVGADDFLSKPLDPEALRRALETQLAN